ncbi:MAG TPA: alpha/beta hydrolase [Candidatus Limnocylindrales bacterium]|nr:alpha/beta hydrolase [Candidatus Limnocylindrales bacterium]
MTTITTDDGVRLHVEDVGSGFPILFVHEFAGDAAAYEPQLRHFARRHRCIAYNARGYPPSDVPSDVASYSQDRARDDIRAVLDGLGIEQAHVVGTSMGAFATLHFGFAYPERARSLTLTGCGYGAEPLTHELFLEETLRSATAIETSGMAAFAAGYAVGPARVQFEAKDPRGWAEFASRLADHSPIGAANTLRGVQARRPSLWDLMDRMRALEVPTLVIVGDEDHPCLAPAVLLKQTILTAGLAIVPNTGHAVNTEEPDVFNRLLDDFFHAVEAGRWPRRDPRAITTSIYGPAAAT